MLNNKRLVVYCRLLYINAKLDGRLVDMGKIEFRTLRENVVDAIRMKILTGEYPPGTRIIELAISEEFGVSRGPIREALRQLEQEGLVEYIRNVGCSVKEVTAEDVREVYLIRSSLEILAIREYAGKITDEDMEQIDEILARMKVLPGKNLQEIIDCDYQFHKLIVAKAKLPRLLDFWEQLNYGAVISLYNRMDEKDEIAQKQYVVHSKIAEAFRNGDMELAITEVQNHYMRTLNKMRY